MEPEGSSHCSQHPATGPYPDPHESSPHPPTLFLNFLFNIILTSTPRSSEWSLPFRYSDQNCIRVCYLSHACYIFCPSHPLWLEYCNNVRFTCVLYTNTLYLSGPLCQWTKNLTCKRRKTNLIIDPRHPFQTDSWYHPASCLMDTGVKWPEREADDSPPSSAEV
jgi:hypothetical protein